MVTLTAAPMGNVALQDHGIPTEMIFLNPHANKSQRLVPSDVAKLIGSPMSESYSENGVSFLFYNFNKRSALIILWKASPIIMPTEATNAAQTTKRIDRQGVALSRVTPAVAEIKLSAAAGFVHSRSPSIDSPVIPFSTNSRGESVSSYTTYGELLISTCLCLRNTYLKKIFRRQQPLHQTARRLDIYQPQGNSD